MRQNGKILTMEMKAKLSALWIYVLLNIIFRDFHELVRPGYLEEMMTGVMNGAPVTEGMLLLGGVMLQLPIGMVVLSQVLRRDVNRWANVLAGAITIILIVINNTTPDLDDILFAALEVVALSLIIWQAWKWPNAELQSKLYNQEKYS